MIQGESKQHELSNGNSVRIAYFCYEVGRGKVHFIIKLDNNIKKLEVNS